MSADTSALHVDETRRLLESIVRALVDDVDQVQVTIVPGTHTTIFEVRVAPTDTGKVIGKKGIHADAIRRLLHALAGKHRRRYQMEIPEDPP